MASVFPPSIAATPYGSIRLRLRLHLRLRRHREIFRWPGWLVLCITRRCADSARDHLSWNVPEPCGRDRDPSLGRAARRTTIGRLHRCADADRSTTPPSPSAPAVFVKLDLTVPGYEIAVSRDPGRDPKHQASSTIALAGCTFRASTAPLERSTRGSTFAVRSNITAFACDRIRSGGQFATSAGC